MAKRSFISKLTGSIIGGENTTFLNLDYKKDSDPAGSKSDISELDIEKHTDKSPTLKISKGNNPEIPIIGIGGAGIRLLSEIVDRVAGYGMKYTTMAFDTDKSDLEKYDNITHKFHIPGGEIGTSHQYRIASSRVKKGEEKVKIEINEYIRDMAMTYKHEIVFLIMGAGGTGVGAGIEIARILQGMGKRPVPFLILPTKDEMSRIKFNAAAGLYYFNYAPKDRCLNLTTIIIDNEAFIQHNSKKYYSSVISSSNERIAATIGDLIATTELESHAYSSDLNEFLEIFRDLKGIGTLQYLQIESPGRNIVASFEKFLDDSLSIGVDIFDATRGYIYISSKKEQILAEDFRNLMLKFENSDIFSKLYEIDSDQDILAIRGVYTGISYPSHIEEIMQIAEDARVEVLNKEIDTLNSGKVNPKIDRLDADEEIDVKTGQELQESRAEEYARMRREGDDDSR